MTAENASSEDAETFDPKPYLDRLTKRLQSVGKTVCAVTVATEAAESAIRYTELIKSILQGYDIDINTLKEEDIKTMTEGHQTMLAHCVSECLAFARITENLYEVNITPLVTRKHGTSPILCAECCTCTGFYDCEKETKWEEMLGQVLDLKDALTGVMVHIYHMASDPGEFRMPLADVNGRGEGRDGKSL